MRNSLRKVVTKYSFLLRIMITLFVFICIPALLVSYSITSRTYQEYIESSIRTDRASLGSYASYFTNQISRMRLLASRIGYERRVTLEYIDEKPYNVQEVMRTLGNYLDFVPVVSRIGVSFGDGYIYTDAGRISQESYLNEAINTTGVGTGSSHIPTDEASMDVQANIRERLTDYDSPYAMYSTFGKISDRETLYVFVPVVTTSRFSSHFMVIYEISKETFHYSTTEEGLGKSYHFGIFDSQNNLLFSESKLFSDITKIADPDAILARTSGAGIPLLLDEIDYTAYGIGNAGNNLSYVMYSAAEDVGTSLESFYRVLRSSVVWVVILFVGLSIATAYLNYRPIVKLVKRVRPAGSGPDGKPQNELQTISNAIDNLSSQNEEMQELLSNQRELLVDSLFSKLIEGIDVSREEIEQLEVDLTGPYYCVMIMQTPDIHTKELQKFAADLSRQCEKNLYMIDIPYKTLSAIICNLADKNRIPRDKIAGSVRATLVKAGFSVRKIGVGVAVGSPSEIRTSYYTAISSFENEQKQDVVFFEDVIEKFEIVNFYPAESILKLIQYIKHGDKENASAELVNITSFMNNNNTSTLTRQYLCFNIINTLISALMKFEITMTTHEISSILYHSNVVDGFQQTLTEFISRTCDKVIAKKSDEENELLGNIVRYVDENVTNSNLSLTSVADKFDLPIYTISRMFKKATEMGFSEYITQKRIDYSKLLLMTAPDKSTNEIALLSGFTNVSYFIKIFKSMCGVTPSKYRSI